MNVYPLGIDCDHTKLSNLFEIVMKSEDKQEDVMEMVRTLVTPGKKTSDVDLEKENASLKQKLGKKMGYQYRLTFNVFEGMHASQPVQILLYKVEIKQDNPK